jgi:hypothetical protein
VEATDHATLRGAAESMIAQAQAKWSDRAFSATGFASDNISILHQQVRCANLAWALRHTKRVKRGDVVAIVGGSFSGIMLACSLAIADDVIVYLFEKEKRLLDRFLDKGHRYLSPNLNSRYLGRKFDPYWSDSFFRPPIFEWSEGTASEVAWEWLREFERYLRKLPIFTFLHCEVTKRNIKERNGGLTIDFRERKTPHLRPIEVDLLIDATGFGGENNPLALTDYSYWESGHRLIYDHLPAKCDVLVSGCGDSGLIEAIHYAITGFRHEFVEKLWPSHSRLEFFLDQGLEDARLDVVLKSEDVWLYDSRVISELCWWLETWGRVYKRGESPGWALRRYGPPIFRKIEEVMRPHLSVAFPGRNLTHLEWDEREAFVKKLSLEVQLEVRNAVRPVVDTLISQRMGRLLEGVAVSKLLRVRKLHQMARAGVSVSLNDKTPTAYTRQLSTYNAWLMRVLMSFPNVRYRPGSILDVKPDGAGRFRVTYEDGSSELYDRVVTRYGPKQAHPLLTRRYNAPHAGEWLLSRVRSGKMNPAIHQVARKVQEVAGRRGSDSAGPLDKFTYKQSLLVGSPASADKRYADPQAWLTSTLLSGKRPSYTENYLLEKLAGRLV